MMPKRMNTMIGLVIGLIVLSVIAVTYHYFKRQNGKETTLE